MCAESALYEPAWSPTEAVPSWDVANMASTISRNRSGQSLAAKIQKALFGATPLRTRGNQRFYEATHPDPRKRVLMFLCGKSSPWMETGFLCSTKKTSLAHMFHDERQHPKHTWAAASMTTKGTLSKSQCESTASPCKRNGGHAQESEIHSEVRQGVALITRTNVDVSAQDVETHYCLKS